VAGAGAVCLPDDTSLWPIDVEGPLVGGTLDHTAVNVDNIGRSEV